MQCSVTKHTLVRCTLTFQAFPSLKPADFCFVMPSGTLAADQAVGTSVVEPFALPAYQREHRGLSIAKHVVFRTCGRAE